MGVHENYLDSLTTLVFLLLISRYFLKKIQDKALSAKDLHFFYQGESVKRLLKNQQEEGYEEIHPKFIKAGDYLKVLPGEIIPADGTVFRGKSYCNMSLLTGESSPVVVQERDQVFAGTQNISAAIIFEVEKLHSDSRLGEILKSVENGWSKRAPIVDITDRISKYFIITVFFLSAVLFVTMLLQSNGKIALEYALTLMIVTCPCALALSVPLTFTRALNQAADNGIIIKNEAVIQKLSEIKNILIDKTGTLTLGSMQVHAVNLIKNIQGLWTLEDIIYNLEKHSQHPIARALVQYAIAKNAKELIVDNYVEVPGVGVRGLVNQRHYEINRSGLLENGELLATFSFSDLLRSDSKTSIQKLQSLGVKISLLSGDKKVHVKNIAKQLALSENDYQAELSPEEKSLVVKTTDKVMMIGDGANDAIAFSYAHVGVAVLGSMDMALRAADIYLVTPGISSIYKLMTLGQETMKVIRRNLVLSLLYNFTSVVLVFTGHISPLVAAIIMPISSLTVLASSLWGTKKLRMLWKS